MDLCQNIDSKTTCQGETISLLIFKKNFKREIANDQVERTVISIIHLSRENKLKL